MPPKGKEKEKKGTSTNPDSSKKTERKSEVQNAKQLLLKAQKAVTEK